MRFELAAAYGMGVALPLLEVIRRRTDLSTISGYVDDFIAGALVALLGLVLSTRSAVRLGGSRSSRPSS